MFSSTYLMLRTKLSMNYCGSYKRNIYINEKIYIKKIQPSFHLKCLDTDYKTFLPKAKPGVLC